MIKAEVVIYGTSDNIEFEGTMEELSKELLFLVAVMGRRFYKDSGEIALNIFRDILQHNVEDDEYWEVIRESAMIEEEEEDYND